MTETLHRRSAGYYAGGDPFGSAGDFVTAPEISQMFGELLGLWLVLTWQQAGRPAPASLVELGPGRGTLMTDMLRAMSIAPDTATAFDIHLVEINPDLRALQAIALADVAPQWHDDISTLPDGPWFVVANEFFDSLPIHQIVMTDGAWRESLVVADVAGTGLAWGLDRVSSPLAALLPPRTRAIRCEGAVAEVCPTAVTLTTAITERITASGGAMILIDYGDLRDGAGYTLQAVRAHQRVDPLATPGLADLSSHVDFSALLQAARSTGARASGPVGQGRFLARLGIHDRARMLARQAAPSATQAIDAALCRLIAPAEMGTLFKVIAITVPTVPVPAGFEETAEDAEGSREGVQEL